MLQAEWAKKDEEWSQQLSHQAELHQQELQALQAALREQSRELHMAQRQTAALLQQQQLEWERLEQQHAAEVARLQQQLEEACAQARSAEAAVVHIRCDACGVCWPKWPSSKGVNVSMPVCCALLCVQVNVCMHQVRKTS